MLPIPIVWTNYTFITSGRVLKLVPCENCSTEYVYLLEREGEGSGTSFYLMNEDGAQADAVSSAKDALNQYLENDFDPIPCPVCGHYQRHMHPKLYVPAAWLQGAQLAVLAACVVCAVIAMYCTFTYLLRFNSQLLWRMLAAWVVLAVFGFLGARLRVLERSRAQRYDPNTGDPQPRIAVGRSRASTRAEFEARQRERTGGRALPWVIHNPGRADTAGAEPAAE